MLVVGGGVAGCAAAVGAARAGATVTLVEATRHLGGVAAQGEHRTLCGLAAIDAARPELIEPELTAAWTARLATGAPYRAGRVWLWPTDADALQAGLAAGLREHAIAMRFAATLDAVEIAERVVAVRIAGERVAVDAVIDASGRAAVAALAGCAVEDARQWGAHRSVLRLALGAGKAERVRALATARAALGGDAAIALTPLAPERWQLSLDQPPGAHAAVAAAQAQRVALALGGELVACARVVGERDQGRPPARLGLAELFASRDRGLCWAAWPREEHRADGVAWTWPAADRHGVPEIVARPLGAPAGLWLAGKALAVDVAAAAALRVTGTALAMGGAIGALAARRADSPLA
ncbi:MAG TPA: FAD-dependent oxidoreductase [Planctomycetota bacterium]|nr:FAD-dependent oxidoreductase [Planctomycetota bacterium]